jgi:hypothetical protein
VELNEMRDGMPEGRDQDLKRAKELAQSTVSAGIDRLLTGLFMIRKN